VSHPHSRGGHREKENRHGKRPREGGRPRWGGDRGTGKAPPCEPRAVSSCPRACPRAPLGGRPLIPPAVNGGEYCADTLRQPTRRVAAMRGVAGGGHVSRVSVCRSVNSGKKRRWEGGGRGFSKGKSRRAISPRRGRRRPPLSSDLAPMAAAADSKERCFPLPGGLQRVPPSSSVGLVKLHWSCEVGSGPGRRQARVLLRTRHRAKHLSCTSSKMRTCCVMCRVPCAGVYTCTVYCILIARKLLL
jgi:hypothetical protein